MPKTRKLKQFLLRYEPVGIGLQIQEGEEVSVLHEDLPPRLTTKQEIEQTVDDLIQRHNETGLLSKKRHRDALVTTLGRLYEVNVEDEEDAGGGRASDEDAAAGGLTEGPIQVNMKIVLTGLTGKQQVLNGETATVIKARGEKQKYEVAFDHPDREPIKVKGREHLLPVKVSKVTLAEKDPVAIRGLRNHIELNGCVAFVVECHEEAQRYEVRAFESQQLFRVKKENLIAIEDWAAPADIAVAKENREPNTNSTPRKKEGGLPAAVGEGQVAGGDLSDSVLEIGSTVELVGLKTAQAYNGQQAEVLSVDRVRSRYEIRLGDGSVKTIRAENVRLVQGKSPRSKRPKDKNA